MKYAPKELCPDIGETDPTYLPKQHVLPACLMSFSPKLRAFTDSRDDMALGHVVVLLQHEWPRGESLFLKAINKICQQGNFQYENFFNYVTSILSLTKSVLHTPNCLRGIANAVWYFQRQLFSTNHTGFISIAREPLVIGQILGLR